MYIKLLLSLTLSLSHSHSFSTSHPLSLSQVELLAEQSFVPPSSKTETIALSLDAQPDVKVKFPLYTTCLISMIRVRSLQYL